jgi:hypothetical protein
MQMLTKSANKIGNTSQLLANFCEDATKYSEDLDLAATIRQACETIVGKASWSYATGCSATYFSKGALNSMVMSVAHIDDQNPFEMALPIAVLSGENSHAKEAIVIMRQRYGDAWFISRFV